MSLVTPVTRSEMTWYLQLKGTPLYKLEKLSLKDIRTLYNVTKNPIKELDIKTLNPEVQADLALALLIQT